MMNSRGVYFVANDRIMELTIAFLKSFRMYNPEMPLCLIPFRDDCEKLKRVSSDYQFSVFEDPEILTLADQISLLFHSEVTGHYRKLACWHGPFGEFIYIDVDMVVLQDLSFAFSLLDHFGFITSCSNIAEAEQWVWKPSVRSVGVLTDSQVSYAANTGFIVSKKGHIPLANLYERSQEALELKDHMELFCKEQPLLNYLIVTSGLPYTSLWSLTDSPLYPENYLEYWAGNGSTGLVDGFNMMHQGKLRKLLLIHWAGVWQPGRNEIRVFKVMNLLKLRRRMWTIRLRMPLKKIWKSYRKGQVNHLSSR